MVWRVGLIEFFGLGIEEFGSISPEHFFTLPAVNALRPLVPEKDLAFEVAHLDGIARLVEKIRLFRDLLLGFLAIADIAHDRDEIIAIETNVLHVDFDRKGRPVFAPMAALENLVSIPANFREVIPQAASRHCQHLNIGNAHGQHFLSRVAQSLPGALVDVEKPSGFGVDHFDRIVRLVNQGAKQLERFLALLAFRHVVHDRDEMRDDSLLGR